MEKTDKSAEDYWFEYSHESIVEGLRGITEANFKAAIRACQKDSAAQQLSEYKEVIKELLPLAQNFASTLRWDEEYSGDEVGGKEAQEIVDRAKKLIEK